MSIFMQRKNDNNTALPDIWGIIVSADMQVWYNLYILLN